MFRTFSGNISSSGLYTSNGSHTTDSRGLFPIVTLSSELIEGNSKDGFEVK